MSHAIGFTNHDHRVCVSGTVATAAAECKERGLRFTPIRKRVLEILLEEHRALGAYEVLDKLREEGLGSQPPTAYRALDFLVKYGLAHRIEKLNAFVACVHPKDLSAHAFLICRQCETVAETPSPMHLEHLDQTANAIGFKIERTVLEVEGLCPNCQDDK